MKPAAYKDKLKGTVEAMVFAIFSISSSPVLLTQAERDSFGFFELAVGKPAKVR